MIDPNPLPSDDPGGSPPAADPALRRKADAVDRARTAGLPDPFEAWLPEAAQALVQELRVHQIELEMQNEELRRTQVELAATRARYFDLFDLAPVGYLIVRESGLILQANLTAAAMLGEVRGALTDRPVSRFIFKADQDTWYLCRKRLVNTGEPQSCELRVVKPDGAHLWVLVAISAACADDGTPLHRVTLTDISESKQAEAALRTSNERFELAVAGTTDGLWDWDRTTDAVYYSPRFKELLGYADDDPRFPNVFESFRERLHPEDLAATEEAIRRAVEDGVPYRAVYRLRTATGDWCWFEARGATVRDPQGRTTRMAGSICDLTARRRSEAELRDSEELFRSFFEAPGGLRGVVELETGDIIHVRDNPDAARFFGRSQRELEGRRASELGVPPEAIRFWTERYLECSRTGVPVQFEFQVPGSGMCLMVAVSPLPMGQTGRTRFAYLATDTTERKQAESALVLSEERFKMLAGDAPVGIFETDAGGNCLFVNARWCKLASLTRDAAMGRGWVAALHPDDRERVFREWSSATEARCEFFSEYRFQTAAGDIAWLSGNAVTLRDTAGVTIGFIGTVTDITARKQVEDALRQSEEQLRAIIDNEPECVKLLDRDGKLLTMNPAGLRMIEADDLEQVRGVRVCSLLNPVEQCAFDQLVAATFRGEHGSLVFEMQGLKGTRRTLETQSVPMWDADHREVRALLGVTRDITDRKRAEAGLVMRDRAIQAVNQGIVITDPILPDNPIVYVSPGFERMTGYASAEVVGRNCRFLQGKDTDKTEVAQIAAAVRGGVSHSGEMLNYRKDGSTFWNELSITPVRDPDGRLVHFVGIQTDVTARRSLEDQLRQAHKMEAVGQLAGGVAHDFNNLLTVINGYGDLLLSELPTGDPHREFVASISEAGERAARLTRQLLAFSRKTILAPQVLDLREMVEKSAKMLRPLIGENIVLAVINDPAPVRVSIDPGQLDQVIMNLVLNARDAMPNGGNLTVEAKTVELDEEYARLHPDVTLGKYVLMSVSDSGSGMTPEVKARLFEPFFTTKGVGKGTGLGLAMVMGIVKQSGGHVAVYSELDHGTTFKLHFPAVEEQADTTKGHSGVAAVRGAETVLLVEDEDAIRGLALMVLQSHGYKVLSARDGKEALLLVAKHQGPIQLLFTDVVMPGMGGRELADALQPRYPQMKVIYSSGYHNDAVVRRGIVEAEVAFLQKPYSLKALASTVRHVLDQK